MVDQEHNHYNVEKIIQNVPVRTGSDCKLTEYWSPFCARTVMV